MSDSPATSRISLELPLPPRNAFDAVADELAIALERHGILFEPTAGGRVTRDAVHIGDVPSWEPGARMAFEWRGAEWQGGERTRLDVRYEPSAAGTRVTVEHVLDWNPLGGPGEAAGWFAGEVLAPLLHATTPQAMGDWFTDRHARRPFGPQARATYADPLYHYPNFRVLLEELALSPDDDLLEVGCGGGALLREALRSGCSAAAIDHSHDMVRVAREANREAIDQGRLRIEQATADRLPFGDRTFTKAVMTGVLGFLPDPVQAFREIRRVLRPGGLFVGLGSDPEMKGTPAAPEPMASRLRFYDDAQLEALARDAGFEDVRVIQRDLGAFAREAGVPEEHLSLFEGAPARFLIAGR
jgi:SAM-dependent methyltransferase